MRQNFPFQVPGFGCSYSHEYRSNKGNPFELQFLKHLEKKELYYSVPVVFFLLENGKAKINDSLQLNSSQWLGFPAKRKIKIKSQINVLKFVVIGLSAKTAQNVAKTFDIPLEDINAVFVKESILVKSRWLDELFHRYVFERSIAENDQSLTCQFCEEEITKEFYYKNQSKKTLIVQEKMPPRMQIALGYIEQNLHKEISISQLAGSSGMSSTTLRRDFQKFIGLSPIRYVWQRRLQEAKALLTTGNYQVTEVAIHAKFADASSFSQAYKREFGVNPQADLKVGV